MPEKAELVTLLETMNSDKTDERHIICTVRSKSAHRESVRDLLLELVEPARAEPGCLYYDVYQQEKDADTFYIIDGWRSEEAIKAHSAHPNVPRVVALLEPFLEAPLTVTISKRLSDHCRDFRSGP